MTERLKYQLMKAEMATGFRARWIKSRVSAETFSLIASKSRFLRSTLSPGRLADLRIIRLDHRRKFRPRHDHVHVREKPRAARRLGVLLKRRQRLPLHRYTQLRDFAATTTNKSDFPEPPHLALDFGCIPVVPAHPHRIAPWRLKEALHHRRNEIGRLLRRLKGFRHILCRFDKLDLSIDFIYFALIVLALQGQCKHALEATRFRGTCQ